MKESLKDKSMNMYQILGMNYFLEKLKSEFVNHQLGNNMTIEMRQDIIVVSSR